MIVAVQDTGIGIEPDKANKLFDAFFTTKPDGMGMGLSICRSIIEAHGGRIWASANAGPGATLQFTLPQAQAEPPARRVAADRVAAGGEFCVTGTERPGVMPRLGLDKPRHDKPDLFGRVTTAQHYEQSQHGQLRLRDRGRGLGRAACSPTA